MQAAYARLLELARQQSAALARADLDAAVGLLDARAEILVDAPAAGPRDADAIREIMQLDRELSSRIRERMIDLRNEAMAGQHGRVALSGYGRRMPGRAQAIDRVS